MEANTNTEKTLTRAEAEKELFHAMAVETAKLMRYQGMSLNAAWAIVKQEVKRIGQETIAEMAAE